MFVKNKIYYRPKLHKKYGGRVRYGISNCPKHPIIFIFSGETGKQYGYKDGWDDDKYFWYSGEGQIGNMEFTGGNKSLRDHEVNEKKVFLFEKTKESGYWKFIDQLKLVDIRNYLINFIEKDINKTREGIQFKFISVSHNIEIKEDLQQSVQLVNKKIYDYNEPGETERKGLVTTRIGQGAYRIAVLKKWNNKCGVTGSNIKKILIASHIVPWSKSNDIEKKDVENGILLSPDIDALFDRHLISFNNTGEIIIPSKISKHEQDKLGINEKMKLSHVSNGMKSYLSRHREAFNEKNK
tara:strand:- start:111 stop:998 length:888 start_codon:yes stop_codon:yes gene_type:complete